MGQGGLAGSHFMIVLCDQVGGRSESERLINPFVLLLLLHDYNMTYKSITPFETRYDAGRQDCDQEKALSVHLYGPLLLGTRDGYLDQFKLDAVLLREALSQYAGPRDATLAEQVFGGQARQQRIGLGHLSNTLYERSLLHANRLRDIDRRLVDCQDRLSVLKMHLPLDAGKVQQHLEKLIIDLEGQRHDEQVSFWKDSTEIRQLLFDNAAAYGAARRRRDMLGGLEANGV